MRWAGRETEGGGRQNEMLKVGKEGRQNYFFMIKIRKKIGEERDREGDGSRTKKGGVRKDG